MSLAVWRRVSTQALPILPLADVKAHCRIDDDCADFDGVLAACRLAAIAHVESYLGWPLGPEVWTASFSSPDADGGLRLSHGPNLIVQKVETTQGGVVVALPIENYRVRPEAGMGRVVILPSSGSVWPSVDRDPLAFIVTAQLGCATADVVPDSIKAALLLLIGDLFSNRDGKIPTQLTNNPTVDFLLSPHRHWPS